MSLPHPQPREKITLSEIFNAYASQTVRDFPELKGRFVILDVEKNVFHGKIDLEKTGFSSIAEASLYLGKHAENSKKTKLPETLANPKYGIRPIFYNNPDDFRLFGGKSSPEEWNVVGILDHELGHLLVPNGVAADTTLSSKNFAECTADAYALIRHAQRYGDMTKVADYVRWKRSYDMINTGETVHFTAYVIDALVEHKDKIDFKAMTPDQTRTLAWRFAAKYAPPTPVLNTLTLAFAPFRRALKENGKDFEASLKTLADITLKGVPKSHVFKTGKKILDKFLYDYMRYDGKAVELKGSYWDNVREQLKTQEFLLEQEGILAGIPRSKTPAANENKFGITPK